MSYTELLLVVGVTKIGTTSRRGAEPAHPVVGRTKQDQELGIADHAGGEVLWRIRREAARRVKLSDRTGRRNAEHRGESVLSVRTRRGAR
jgi:hypothetical protein